MTNNPEAKVEAMGAGELARIQRLRRTNPEDTEVYIRLCVYDAVKKLSLEQDDGLISHDYLADIILAARKEGAK